MIKKINKEEFIRVSKYLFSAGSSFILDLVLFTIFNFLFSKIRIESTYNIFISTIFARIISSLYNYFINSRLVFKNKSVKGIIGYFVLVLVQMMVSASLVSLVEHYIPANVTFIKLLIDVIIFIINYIIQKEIVFK